MSTALHQPIVAAVLTMSILGLPTAWSAQSPEDAVAAAEALLQPDGPAAIQAKASPRDRFIRRTSEPLRPDAAGEYHVRFDRQYAGLPVRGGDIIVHLNSAGSLTRVTTTLTQPVALPDTTPTVDRDRALGRALEWFRREGKDESSAVELVIDTQRDPPTATLVWLAKVSGSRCKQPSLMHYFIDANTGALLRKYEGVNSLIPIRC